VLEARVEEEEEEEDGSLYASDLVIDTSGLAKRR